MPIADIEQFTHSHHVLDDGGVVFRCSDDREKWPWLALDPLDPIVVQTINFWVASAASAARGTLDPTKWTALTQTEWTCGEPGVGHATHGIAEPDGADGTPGFRLTLFDRDGALVYRMTGTGVVFQNRDFESWREEKKQAVAEDTAPIAFKYVGEDKVALGDKGVSVLGAITDGDVPSAPGLITKENGFPPGNPYLSGSGDHVNATHLAEIGRQFASQLAGGAHHACPGGEMQFNRFVELDSPFQVQLVPDETKKGQVTVTIHQADRLCATVMLRLG